MHDLVYFDGRIMKAKDALLSAVSPAAFYGKGTFTTLSIHQGKPFLWQDHWQRLSENAQTLSIDLSRHSPDSVLGNLSEIVKENRINTGRARITFYDRSPGVLWGIASADHASLLITTADPRSFVGDFRVGVSSYPIYSASPLTAVKSCNYLDKMAAFEDSNNRGWQESVRLNERGDVVSACMANIFWTRDGRLFTPSLETGCLPGTTRAHILRNFECEEVEQRPEVLDSAESMFLTSAGLGVRTIDQFLDRKLDRPSSEISGSVP